LIVYVTATDKFYSRMIGKISKLVYVCRDSTECDRVWDMATRRHDLKYLSVRTTKPHYNSHKYDTSFRDSHGNKIKYL